MDEDKTAIFQAYERIRGNGEEELFMAIENGDLKVDTTNQEGMTPFLLAVDECFSLDILETLLEKGADINHQDESGASALHYA